MDFWHDAAAQKRWLRRFALLIGLLLVLRPTEGAQARDTSSYREWTGWVLAALFAVMLLEWEVSRRGAGI